MNRGLNSAAGLTLVEIMIVLVILGIVMATVGSKVFGAGDKAKRDLTDLKMQQLKADIEQFQLRYNSLPNSLEDLTSCTENTGQGCLPISSKESVLDAWETPFQYSANGRSYQIKSLGADKREGGDGADYDLTAEGP